MESLDAFLRHAKIHRALVFDDDGLAGIVTTFDVLDAVSGEVEPDAVREDIGSRASEAAYTAAG